MNPAPLPTGYKIGDKVALRPGVKAPEGLQPGFVYSIAEILPGIGAGANRLAILGVADRLIAARSVFPADLFAPAWVAKSESDCLLEIDVPVSGWTAVRLEYVDASLAVENILFRENDREESAAARLWMKRSGIRRVGVPIGEACQREVEAGMVGTVRLRLRALAAAALEEAVAIVGVSREMFLAGVLRNVGSAADTDRTILRRQAEARARRKASMCVHVRDVTLPESDSALVRRALEISGMTEEEFFRLAVLEHAKRIVDRRSK